MDSRQSKKKNVKKGKGWSNLKKDNIKMRRKTTKMKFIEKNKL